MAQFKDSLASNSWLMTVRGIPKHRDTLIILGSVLIGLVLARFTMISPLATIMVLSCGIVISLTFLGRTHCLISIWFVLTSVIWFASVRLFPPQYFGFLGRAIFWGILLCVMASWALNNFFTKRAFVPFNNTMLKVAIFIFMFWSTMTLFTSVDPLNTLKQIGHLVIVLTAAYTFYDYFSRDYENIKKTLLVLFFVVFIMSFIAVIIGGYGLIFGVPVYKQISLWFINPNVLGYILFMTIPICVVTAPKFIRNRGVGVFVVGTMLLGLFFSFHRTSWLAALVSIAFLLLKSRVRVAMWTVICGALFISGLLFPVIGGDVYDYLTGERYTGRTEIWEAAWTIGCENPVLGVGLGNVMQVMPRYIEKPWLRNQDTHSVYLKNIAEMGFPAAVLTLGIYMIFLFSSESIEKNLKSNHLRLLVRGTTATFLGLLVHGIFENGYFFTPFVAAEFHALLPYIFLAIPFAVQRLEQQVVT